MAILAFVLPAFAAGPASAAATGLRANDAAKHERLTPKQRAKIRRALVREVHRNPAATMKRSFIRKAALVDFRLPFTVRLARSDGAGGFQASDDQLEVTWDDSAVPWPTGGQPAAVQTTMLDGVFSLEADFGGDASGTGELGTQETIGGYGIKMTATPFAISDFNPLCPTSPEIATQANTAITVSSAGSRYGLMNMFSGRIRGTLNLRATFRSDIAGGCGGLISTSPLVDNSDAPPMPLRYDGKMTIAPAITPDGKLRFGRITIDDAVTPQVSTFAYLQACVDTADPCTKDRFPARLKLKKMTADLLLGDAFPVP